MHNLLSIIVTVVGFIAQLGLFAQAYKIFANKTIKNISISTYYLFLPNFILWLIYGITLSDYPIIISSTIATLGALLIITAYNLYKNSDNNLSQEEKQC